MNKRAVGTAWEKEAGAYLERLGFRIICYNFRSRYGEIDLIAMEGNVLVFVEVKYRSGDRRGYPEEAVDSRKRRKICQTALYYMSRYGYSEAGGCRFDVVAFDCEKVRLLRNAFEFEG